MVSFHFGFELFSVFCFFCFTSFALPYSQKEPKSSSLILFSPFFFLLIHILHTCTKWGGEGVCFCCVHLKRPWGIRGFIRMKKNLYFGLLHGLSIEL